MDNSLRPTSGRVAQFITQNFALTSSIFVLSGIVSGMIYLWGMMAPLDPSIIWFLEYTDIPKIALIGLANLWGVVLFVVVLVRASFEALSPERSRRRFYVMMLVASMILFGVSPLLDLTTSNSPLPIPVYMILFGVISLIIVLAVTIAYPIRTGGRPTALLVIIMGMCLTAVIFGIGYAQGLMYKHQSSFNQTVVLDSRRIDDVVVVMYTSHHALLLAADGTLIVVRSDDIHEVRLRSQLGG